jgi:hypothetical protein
MRAAIGQLLFDFMPCKYEYELEILQLTVSSFGDYNKKHLEDDTWFRKKWIDENVKKWSWY